MSPMPNWLRKSPRILYIASIAWVIWSVAYPYLQISAAGYSPQLSGEPQIAKFVMLEHVARAVLDAIFLVGSGIMTQVLLHIYDVLAKGPAE